MDIQLESREPHAIQSYSDHSVKVNELLYEAPLLVSKFSIDSDWSASGVADLTIKDLHLDTHQPEIVIIGHSQAQVSNLKLASQLSTQGIGFECMSIGAACRTFNVLLGEGRNVLIGIIF